MDTNGFEKEEAIKKQQANLLQSSFNTSFYNDAFQQMCVIADKNIDNPAQLEQESSAYIDGVTSNIDEKHRKPVYDVLKSVQGGYVERAFERFNKRQQEEAYQTAQSNLINSGKMAINANKLNLPERVQETLIANAQANIVDAVNNKTITQQQGVQLSERLARGLILNHLGDIIRSNEYTTEEKMDAVYSFQDGQTGIDVIDSASPEARMQAIQQALSIQTQIESFNKNLEEKNKIKIDNEWDDREVALQNFIRSGGDLRTAEDMANYQRATATKPEQFNRVDNDFVSADTIKTPPNVKAHLDNVFHDGTLTKEQKIAELNKFDEISSISPEDFRGWMDMLDSPLELNLKKQSVIIAKERAKALYGYAEEKENPAYQFFLSELYENLSDATSNEDISTAIKKAYDAADTMYSERTTAGETIQIENFAKRFKIKPEQIELRIRQELVTINKKAPRDPELKAKYLPVAEANVQEAIKKENDLTDDEADVMMNLAKQINGRI